MMKIYTKTGDGGMTGTMRGRMQKSDQLAKAIGSIDELNSWVGMCRYKTPLEAELKRIQTDLFVIASGLAGAGKKLSYSEIRRLEKLIDKLSGELPKLSNFIYPVGELQVVRAVCRRAEREIVNLSVTNGNMVNQNILKYMNRLSDALFVMARWVNFKKDGEEEVWRG